jgi:hypothetical protein
MTPTRVGSTTISRTSASPPPRDERRTGATRMSWRAHAKRR